MGREQQAGPFELVDRRRGTKREDSKPTKVFTDQYACGAHSRRWSEGTTPISRSAGTRLREPAEYRVVLGRPELSSAQGRYGPRVDEGGLSETPAAPRQEGLPDPSLPSFSDPPPASPLDGAVYPAPRR